MILSDPAPLPKSNNRAQVPLLLDMNQNENDNPEVVVVNGEILTYCDKSAERRSDPVPTLTLLSLICTLTRDAFNETVDPPLDSIPDSVTVPKSNENSIGNDGIWDRDVTNPESQIKQTDEVLAEYDPNLNLHYQVKLHRIIFTFSKLPYLLDS